MSETPQEPADPGLGRARRVPRRGPLRLRTLLRDLHHQTWELELLISGLVAFGLIQLPGPVDQLERLAWAQAPATGGVVASLTLTYLKLAIYTLLASFGFHLVVRALWVGLVGLDSIFPRGMRYEKLNTGPVTEELTRTRIPSVRQLIVYTDAVASVTFAVAFAVGLVFLAAIPAAVALLVAAFVVARLIFGEVAEMQVFWTAWVIFALVAVVPFLLDRFLGRRLAPDRWPRRVLRMVILAVLMTTGSWIYSPIFNTLSGHLGPTRVQVSLLSLMVCLGAVFVGYDVLLIHGRVAFAGSPFLPVVPVQVSTLPDTYDELRDPRRGRLDVPSIPGRVVTGSYLPLFVPWIPDRVEPALQEVCPDVPRLGGAGVRLNGSARADSTSAEREADARRILACAGRIWTVHLDGTPVTSEPVFSVHPETRVRGLTWMIPLEGAALDRHLLEVWGPWDPTEVALNEAGVVEGPVVLDGGDRDPLDAPRYHPIPFWRGASGN